MRIRVLAIMLVPFLAGISLPETARSAPELSLRSGQAVFWDGPHIEGSSGQSWDYRLRVLEPGHRLRIGIDHPKIGDVYRVDVTDPSGRRSSFSPGAGLYSSELVVDSPSTGSWKIAVRAEDVIDSAFRMRAKLEAKPHTFGSGKSPVLPNLQVLPPHEASFLMPLTNGSTDGKPTGLDLQGAESCHPEEHAEDGAVRCLRFAFGIRNTGNGPLQLSLGPGGAVQERELLQRIQRADGSYFDRPAGRAIYHKTHGHYHHDAAIGLRLFQVTDPKKGTLEAAGPMRTKGFAHREELLREWDHFYPTWIPFGFGLGAGWADIYEWDRPGNYIDFGLNGDGRYVIRMTADPVGGIRESNEKDNLAYTYLKITGSAVEVLEVGRGKSPWDACKIVVGEGGYPDPPAKQRPAHCSPDTT